MKKSYINPNKFLPLLNKDLKTIIKLITDYGFEIRIVGGAVRDLLLGIEPRDIDLATNANPIETIYILQNAGIDVDIKGTKHGTIKAVINDVKYEITSLAFSISDKNHHLKIKNHHSWQADALRRDFSINALSMDLNGIIYDYCNGLNDLKLEIIRALPNFEEKVKEDPILILRWFKIISKFTNPHINKKDFDIIKENLKGLSAIPEKRFKEEISNIEKSANGKSTLALMKKLGIN